MEVRYRNDLYGNHMLIEIPKEADLGQYTFKMLEKNKISGVLHGKQRAEDGQGFWYVDISNKRTLKEEYKDTKLQLEDMIFIFQQITAILEELRTYLLNETMVVIDPEYIFKDLENDKISVLVLPWYSGKEDLHKLAEFFLDKMNPRDEHGVNASYLFYRQQSRTDFYMYQFLPILEKESILKRQKINEKELIPLKTKENRELDWQNTNGTIEQETNLNELPEDNPDKKYQFHEKVFVVSIIVSVICLGLSFLPYVNIFLKISCRAFASLFFIVFLITMLLNMKNKKQEVEEERYGELPPQELDISIKETVFFDSLDSEEYLKLQWKEKGRMKQYVLKDFPCTVGKIKEESSLCISDVSVSRIHCKIVERDGKAAIMDMNSTNGTFLNGLRIKNGEILEIEKNDEILIGKVTVNVV